MSANPKRAAISLMILAAAMTATATGAADKKAKPPTTEIAAATNAFGAAALSSLVGTDGTRTVVISPYGLSTPLAMLEMGAVGSTSETLRRVLRLAKGRELVLAHKSIHRALATASTPAVTVESGNGVWLSRDRAIEPGFSDRVKSAFGASVEAVEFASPAAITSINSWAAKTTRGLVPVIVDRLEPTTELVIANAVYFKGAWAAAFDPAATSDAPFAQANGETKSVPMMAARLPVEYAAGADLHAVRLPYAGGRFQMTAVTLRDLGNATSAWSLLHGEAFTKAFGKLKFNRQQVDIQLPRFKTVFAQDVTPALELMGLGPVLKSGADYKRLTTAPINSLSVVHRTLLDVNEAGTEAAAVTAVVGVRSLAPPGAAFAADRPFLLTITDTQTGVDLFLGFIGELGN